MPNKNYQAGVRFERERKLYWESLGYTVLRTAGSHGAFDLIALHHGRDPVGVQCKRVSTLAEARRVVGKFKDDHRYFAGIISRIEVKIKGTNEILVHQF